MRILTITTGLLFAITAVFTYANQGVAFIALAFVIGVVMVLQGLVSMLVFFRRCIGKLHLNYILADGMISVLLGCIVLWNRIITDIEIPMFFGLWILFSGTTRIMTSFNIGRRRVGMRKYVFLLGFVNLIFGMVMIVNIIGSFIQNIEFVAISFLLQSINIISAGIDMPKEKSYINKHAKAERKARQRKIAEKNLKKSSKDMKEAVMAVAGDAAEVFTAPEEGDDKITSEYKSARRKAKSVAKPEEMFANLQIDEKPEITETKIEEMIDQMSWRQTLTSFEPIRITDEEMVAMLEKKSEDKTEE